MQKRVLRILIFSAFLSLLILSIQSLSAHRDDPSLARVLGIPQPVQKIPQPASLLVTVIDSSSDRFIDANVALYRIKKEEDGKGRFGENGELVQIKGTRAKHVFFEKISIGKNADGKYEQDFYLEVSALDYEVEKRFVGLEEGEYQEIRIYLEKKRKYDLCKETDGGIDPLKPGTTTYNPVPKLPEKLQKYDDRCKDGDLIEFYCSEKDTLESVELKCPGGCKDGKCVVEPYCVGKDCAPMEKLQCWDTTRDNPFLQSRTNLREMQERPDFEIENDDLKKENPELPKIIPGKKIQGKAIDERPAGGAGGDTSEGVLLEIGVFGEGTGSVSTADGKIVDCTAEKSPCKARYPQGSELRIRANPGDQSNVGSFNQCKQDFPDECIVTMAEDKKVSVRFDIIKQPLRAEFKSTCIDTTRVKQYFCSPYIALPDDLKNNWNYDNKFIPEIPGERIISCPSGYSCFSGRCVQQQRSVAIMAGDVNGDGRITQADIDHLKEMLSREIIPYDSRADFDGDGIVNSYDLYRTEHLVKGDIPREVKLPERELSLSMGKQLLVGAENSLGELKEGEKIWSVEVSQKGASRQSCRPIVMNIEFPRKDQFTGMTTYAGLGTLKYKKLRFVPDCDILSNHEVNNLLREYIIYSTMRREGVPAVDVGGFARVTLSSSDKDIAQGTPHEYMFLQRDKEEKDQIPFMQQFGFSQVLEYPLPEPFNRINYGKSNSFIQITLQNLKEEFEDGERKEIIRAEKEFPLDPVTSARYWLLTQLFDLGDRGPFGNEDYGVDASTGIWKNIPYDMDSSFYCGLSNPYPESIFEINSGEIGKKTTYYAMLHRNAREIFDDPDMLNRMLLLVDKFPFADNKDKMKRTLELRFYYNALYFGSEEFSKKMEQTHIPYKNYQQYLNEAKRILEMKSFETMCYSRDLRGELGYFVQKVKKNPDSIPPAPPQIPVPKI